MDAEMDQAAAPEISQPAWATMTPPAVPLPPTLVIGNFIFHLSPDLQTITNKFNQFVVLFNERNRIAAKSFSCLGLPLLLAQHEHAFGHAVPRRLLDLEHGHWRQ